MVNDGGLIAKLEQWFADQLAALQYDNALVFKTAEVWKHQIAAISAGTEAFDRYQPFAFVSFLTTEGAREGSYDLRQVLEFAIVLGVKGAADGVARFGDANNLGISKIRDLVIDLFDKKRPTSEDFTCDEIYYTGDFPIVDLPRHYAIQMSFEVSQLTV